MKLPTKFKRETLELLRFSYCLAGFTEVEAMQTARQDLRELKQCETQEEFEEEYIARLTEVREMMEDFTRSYVEQGRENIRRMRAEGAAARRQIELDAMGKMNADTLRVFADAQESMRRGNEAFRRALNGCCAHCAPYCCCCHH